MTEVIVGTLGSKVPIRPCPLEARGAARYGRSMARYARSQRCLAAAAIVSLLALGACSDDTADESPTTFAGVVREPALNVADVELLDVSTPDPTPTAMKAEDDGLLVVYFGYTNCPDICPTTMSDVSVALADLPPEQAERVRVAMVTVDPERDTPEVLSEYLGWFFDRPLPLQAADTAALDAAADAFGVRYEVAEHAPGETSYEVSHSAVTYVVDDTGTVRVEWPFGFDTELMADDLASLLES